MSEGQRNETISLGDYINYIANLQEEYRSLYEEVKDKDILKENEFVLWMYLAKST